MKNFDSTDMISGGAIKSIQEELLIETIRYAYDNSSYYRRRFDSLGLLPSHIKGIEDIQNLPFTNKENI